MPQSELFKHMCPLLSALQNQDFPGRLDLDDEILKQLPKAYVAVVDWDALKDHGLMYAGRLRANGVPVEIGYFEGGFHGIANYVYSEFGYEEARNILNGILNFYQRLNPLKNILIVSSLLNYCA